MKYIVLISLFLFFYSCKNNDYELLMEDFKSPPKEYCPGVYWYFMDGNISKEGITKDLESMKDVGINYVLFLEVNVGVPRGEVDFLSNEWKDCFKHAVNECKRLGITMILGVGPGWTGSGGPWVDIKKSMRHLVSETLVVTGSGKQKIYIKKPEPKMPYFGMWVFNEELKKKWLDYYEDVAVLAFPFAEDNLKIKDINEKVLYYREPYSSVQNVKQYIDRDFNSNEEGPVVNSCEIINLTDSLHGDTVSWDVPSGKWTVLRFGIRNNGAVTRPAPVPGLGFECDKADTVALKEHLDSFTEELFSFVGDSLSDENGGLKILHMDSWEMGAQNWTYNFVEEFKKRRGYDPQPFYPVYAGYVVDGGEISERFMWDIRQTMQELMIEYHSGYLKKYANEYGMQLSIEPYDMNPMQDLELGATADIPMCEFWSPGGFNTSFSAIEGSSLGNLKGQRIVPSEAFTAWGDGWKQHPASMKNQTDWAFASGINRLMFHTFQHQSLPDSLRPGMTMGPYGIHWDRNQTWWPYVGEYHKYVTRCQYLLQKGETIADILLLAPEEAPFVFKAPESYVKGDSFMPDKRGYNFDVCPASILYSARVENGYLKFPGGMKYKLLVLPEFERMTPKLLKKIEYLAANGAVIVGNPPKKSPSLSNYPESDKEILSITSKMWGNNIAKGIAYSKYEDGVIVSGDSLRVCSDNLYPNYDIISSVLSSFDICEDFKSSIPYLRYIHKKYRDIDYYFISNISDTIFSSDCRFRINNKQPYLWNPVTGETNKILTDESSSSTTINLKFEPHQSYFIVFHGKADVNDTSNTHVVNNSKLFVIDGSWKVSFSPEYGGPKEQIFKDLIDWSKHSSDSIKYYSGTAVYKKDFKYFSKSKETRKYLDLGKVKNIAKVILNGVDVGILWTEPWRIEITKYLNEGNNYLELEVTNLWPNRLIGDEQKENDGIVNGEWPKWITEKSQRYSSRYTFSTYSHYTKDSKLLESGLLGPVTIIEEY